MSGAPPGRIAAAALLVGLVALVWTIAIQPAIQRRAGLIDEIAAVEAQVARFEAAVRDQAAPPPKAPESALLQAASPTLAAATLQQAVDRMMARSGGVLRSTRVLEPQDVAQSVKIAVRIDATFGLGELMRFLHAVETAAQAGEPLFFVERLDLRAPERSDPAPRLDAQIDIAALTIAPS
jgi:hypothetical protein